MGFFSSFKDNVANSAGSIVSAGVNALGTVAGSLISAKSYDQSTSANKEMNAENIALQREMNDKNIAMQREENEKNRQWQKAENDLARSREDNAYQRAVADAIQAGLSPLVVNNGASAQAMQSAVGVAPQGKAPENKFRINPDTITPGLIATGMKNAVDAFNQSEERRVGNKLKEAQADKEKAETESINISNAQKASQISAQIEQIQATVANLREELKQKQNLTKEQEIKLKSFEKRLENELKIQVATLNEVQANTANTLDVIENRKTDKAIKEHNLAFAQTLGAPVGYVPNNLVSVSTLAGKAISDNKNSEKSKLQQAYFEQYEDDVKYWNIARERARKDAIEHKDYTLLEKWEKNNPKPNKKDYILRKKRK